MCTWCMKKKKHKEKTNIVIGKGHNMYESLLKNIGSNVNPIQADLNSRCLLSALSASI